MLEEIRLRLVWSRMWWGRCQSSAQQQHGGGIGGMLRAGGIEAGPSGGSARASGPRPAHPRRSRSAAVDRYGYVRMYATPAIF